MRSVHKFLTGSLLIVGLAAPAAAQTTVTATPASGQSVAEPNTITVTPFVSTSFGTSQDLGSSLGVGFAVGYDWTRNLGVEFDFGHVFDVAGDDEFLDYRLTNISGNVVYHFDMRHVTPYATVGLGWQYSTPDVKDENPGPFPDNSTEIAWNFGGGAKVPLYGGRLLARVDLRRFQVNDIGPDHWRLYGGVTFWIKR